MAYTALYRKYRPGEFDSVKGQEHIVTTLKNQIKADRMGHAYLFCGTRGTGKTTIAKLFAKSVNCENPVDGSPCGQCPSCKAIAAGSSMNVIEIDAASNNGVDNIRELKEQVEYSPTDGRFKVFIIDEVHMLSTGAFNALLKTLEEPPSYVIFILATTEAHKIPITILSRCQRYDFRRISIDTITDRMRELMEAEQIRVEEKALRYIAKAADGSMRDALSLLDQCIAFHLGQTLTYDMVLDVLGAVDNEVFASLLKKIVAGDVNGCVQSVEELVIQGRELGQFVIDFTWYLRNLLLVQNTDEMDDVMEMASENLAALKEMAQLVKAQTLIRYIRLLSELTNQIRFATQKRVLIEVALIKLCKPQMEKTDDSIFDRLDRLEKQIAQGIVVQAPDAALIATGGNSEVSISGQRPVKPQLPKAISDDIKEIVANWNSICGEVAGATGTFLKGAGLSITDDDKLMVVLEDDVAASYITDNRKEELLRVIAERIGKEVDVVFRVNDTGQPFDHSFIDLKKIEGMLGLAIEVEDE